MDEEIGLKKGGCKVSNSMTMIQFLTKFLMIFQLGVHRRIFTSRVAHYIFSTKVEDNKIKIWPKHVQKNDEIY